MSSRKRNGSSVKSHSPDRSRQDLRSEPPKQYSVPYLQGILFACVLEDTLLQLRILAECNNELRIIKTLTDLEHLKALKFKVEQIEDPNSLDKIDHKELKSNRYKLDKLFADRKFVTKALQKTYLGMALKRCFGDIKNSNKELEHRYSYQAQLSEEESRNKITRRELMRQLRQQRIHIKSVTYDTNMVMENLKCKVEDTEINSRIRSRYVENWQVARTEQHQQKITDKEKGPSVNIDYFQSRAEQEHRVHSEIELLVNISINETLGKVENWMNKYDKDMEGQDLKIAIMKNKYQDSLNKRIQLEETYAKHDLLMKNWNQFKEDRQRARDYEEKMTKSAIIVQAWWRGLLVRLQLGPYKPSKKQRAGKKAKKEEKTE